MKIDDGKFEIKTDKGEATTFVVPTILL